MSIRLSKTLIFVFMLILSIVMLVPLFWVILMSFKDTTDIITSSPFSLPTSFNFQNYINAWVQGNIGKYFWNSIYITGITTLFVIVFGTMIAYALSRMRWKLKNFFFGIILVGMMIPVYATLIPIFITLKTFNLFNSPLCLILPYIASGLPLAVYIFRNFMIGIPKEMEEAACIDGCGVFRSFAFIIVPTIRPAIITVIILTFMGYWNEFVMAMAFIQNKAFATLPIGLQAFQGEFTVDWGSISAGIVVSIIPVLIFYLIFNDMIDKSVVSGALK